MSYRADWSYKNTPNEQGIKRAAKKRRKKRKTERKRQLAAVGTKKDFYSSPEWRSLRYRVLKKYGPECMLCGATRSDGVKIHVDHIKPRSKFPKLELEFTNMQVLCEDCNIGKSSKDQTDWRPKGSNCRAEFDVDPYESGELEGIYRGVPKV